MAVDEDILRNQKILIVDDNPANVFSMRALLETYDMQVSSATSGEEAVAIVGEKPFDVVLMDIRMPGISGYEAIKEIRAIDPAGKIPIIAVTAQAMSGDAEKCLAAGADDYISKPIDSDLLLAKIEKLVHR